MDTDFNNRKISSFLLICITLQNIISIAETAKPYHAVPTYFRRLHENGSLVDAKNPQNQLDFKAITTDPSHLDPAVILKVSPSIVKHGGLVNVSWSGVSSPKEADFIAFFCPLDAISEKYLDYFRVTVAPTWQQGYGQKNSLQLWNMRSECEFRYYGSSKLLARSNPVMFRGGPSAPLQGHLALTNTNNEMRVMWVSGTDKTPIVLYGLDKSVTEMKEGIIKTYSASDMCNTPASGVKFIDPGYIHDVLLTDLKPSTTYYYSFGSPEAMSQVLNFTTAPVVGSESRWTAIIYGDMGTSPAAQRIAQQATAEVSSGNANWIWHDGDIAYAEGYAYVWEQFFAYIEPYATRVPYMVGIGNHEQDHRSGGEKDPSGAPGEGYHPWWAPGYGTDSGGECGVPMYYRFHMPDNGNAVWWYSFNYGSVHFIMISTEHNFTQGSRQYEWLDNDLRNVNRTTTPWVIISGHRAMYTSQKVWNDYVISLGMRHSFENLLHKYEVDLAIWAHYHSYERTCALFNGNCIENGGTVHIVVGTAGKTLDVEQYYPMEWSLYRENNFGYGRLTQLSRSSLLWEWVESSSAIVKDKVLLTK